MRPDRNKELSLLVRTKLPLGQKVSVVTYLGPSVLAQAACREADQRTKLLASNNFLEELGQMVAWWCHQRIRCPCLRKVLHKAKQRWTNGHLHREAIRRREVHTSARDHTQGRRCHTLQVAKRTWDCNHKSAWVRKEQWSGWQQTSQQPTYHTKVKTSWSQVFHSSPNM